MKKTLKFLLTALMAGVLAGEACAQGFAPAVAQGAAGKILVFDQTGADNNMLSLNNRYFILRGGEGSFVYDVQSGKMKVYENEIIIGYKDSANFASASRVKINGTDYVNWTGLAANYPPETAGLGGFYPDGADTSMRYIRVNTYNGDENAIDKGSYITVIVDALGNGGDGKVLRTLKHYRPEEAHVGEGSWAFSSSNDMQILCGRTNYHSVAFSNISPGFWDISGERDTVFYIGGHTENDDTDGTLYGSNNDGSVFAGDAQDRGVIVFYDRESMTFTKKKVPVTLGYGLSCLSAVTEDGRVLGFDQVEYDPGSRTGFIYNYLTDVKIGLDDYLHYLYGIDYSEQIDNLFIPNGISDNGRLIIGNGYRNEMFVPYLIVLDEHQLHAVPMHISARQLHGTQNVHVIWEKPLMEQYTLKGYNVYCDGEKINPNLLPEDAVSFDHIGVAKGERLYEVEAVYTDEQSSRAAAEKIRVLGPDDCLPVVDIDHTILYNKGVTLRWGLPSALVRDGAKAAAVKGPKGYTAQDWLDIIKIQNSNSQSASVPVRIGNYYYASDFYSGTFTLYDAETWKLDTIIYVEGMGMVYDIAANGNSLFVVGRSKWVIELYVDEDNPYDISIANKWESLFDENINIAFEKGANGQEDRLLVGDWDRIVAYPLAPMGKTDTLPLGFNLKLDKNTEIRGTAVHNGYLYMADSRLVPAPPTGFSETSSAGIRVFDMATGEEVSYTNLYDDPAMLTASLNDYGNIGGLTVETMEDGTVALLVLVETYFWYKQFVFVEIESAPEVVGYNVYRNGVKVNGSTPVMARHYTEDLDEPGQYVYAIEYLAKCVSRSDVDGGVADTVVIMDRGTCDGPKALTAKESNKMVILNWDLEISDATTAKFVAFNVYRNEEQVAVISNDIKFRDAAVEAGQNYIYRVEAYYDNSCTASSQVEITPAFTGSAQAPAMVKGSVVTEDDKAAAKLSWKLPYFEEPLSLGYCNLPAGSTSIQEVTQTYAMIGWDSTDIKLFDEDLYLVGAEYFMADDRFDQWNGVVVVDNKIVYNQSIGERIRREEWNTVYFDKIFPMKQKVEIAVGYYVAYDPVEVPNAALVFDMGPGNRGRGDIISADGVLWGYLGSNGIDANLCINALVVRMRDIDQAKLASDPAAYLKEKAFRLDRSLVADDLRLAEDFRLVGAAPIANPAKSTSESFTLKGFNVYKEGEKMNEEPLTVFEYVDGEVEPGEEYEYEVSAVYAQGIEKKAAPVYIEIPDESANENAFAAFGLRLYPNPARAAVRIEGEYASLSVMDINGRLLMSGVRGEKTLSLENLVPGVYFFHFETLSGTRCTVKVIKK